MTGKGDVSIASIAKTIISFHGHHLDAIDSRRRIQREKIDHLEKKTISLRKQTA